MNRITRDILVLPFTLLVRAPILLFFFLLVKIGEAAGIVFVYLEEGPLRWMGLD